MLLRFVCFCNESITRTHNTHTQTHGHWRAYIVDMDTWSGRCSSPFLLRHGIHFCAHCYYIETCAFLCAENFTFWPVVAVVRVYVPRIISIITSTVYTKRCTTKSSQMNKTKSSIQAGMVGLSTFKHIEHLPAKLCTHTQPHTFIRTQAYVRIRAQKVFHTTWEYTQILCSQGSDPLKLM